MEQGQPFPLKGPGPFTRASLQGCHEKGRNKKHLLHSLFTVTTCFWLLSQAGATSRRQGTSAPSLTPPPSYFFALGQSLHLFSPLSPFSKVSILVIVAASFEETRYVCPAPNTTEAPTSIWSSSCHGEKNIRASLGQPLTRKPLLTLDFSLLSCPRVIHIPFFRFPPSPPLSQGTISLFHTSRLHIPDFTTEPALARAALLTQARFIRFALSLSYVSVP